MRACIGLVAATTLGGCSFAFVHGPPAEYRHLAYFDCSSSNVLPAVDAVLGGLVAIDAVAASSGSSAFASSSGSTPSTATIVGAAAEAVLFGASALYGFSKTSDCRQAEAELMARPSFRQPGFGQPTYAPAPPPIDPWTGRPTATTMSAPAAPPATAPPVTAVPVAPPRPSPAPATPVPWLIQN